ncbi:hypothetical protein ACFYXM_22200 [Streptomyces sp. NPDC002476]|uniref:hypothetical protein n=1 Tax=Streptomyces sp. NPDC002476 TaxID=3364648 RepID=UPI0036C8513D
MHGPDPLGKNGIRSFAGGAGLARGSVVQERAAVVLVEVDGLVDVGFGEAARLGRERAVAEADAMSSRTPGGS